MLQIILRTETTCWGHRLLYPPRLRPHLRRFHRPLPLLHPAVLAPKWRMRSAVSEKQSIGPGAASPPLSDAVHSTCVEQSDGQVDSGHARMGQRMQVRFAWERGKRLRQASSFAHSWRLPRPHSPQWSPNLACLPSSCSTPSKVFFKKVFF